MPATVSVNNCHNHLMLNAEALSFRKIDTVTRSKFEEYFEQGMTAAGASEFHSNQLDLDPDYDSCSLAVVRADAGLNPKVHCLILVCKVERDKPWQAAR